MDSVDHRVTVFLVPCDKSIRSVVEAKQAVRAVIDDGSELTVGPAESVRELWGVLRLSRRSGPRVCTAMRMMSVRSTTRGRWTKPGRVRTLRSYDALSSDEASILVQARTECCGLNACLSRKKLADSLGCECGCGGEIVLHVLLRANDMLEPAKRCGKQQATGGVTFRTCWEDGAGARTSEWASRRMAHTKVGSRI